jgi:enoyl-CoA hydratase/carnithine racemase
MYSSLILEREGRLAIVRLNRPERRNALSVAFMREITALAGELRDDAGTDAIILTGAPGWFSAGADLKDEERWGPSSASFAEQREMGRAGYRMASAWEQLPQITIAAIEGYAIGGGLALALACDWRMLARDAFVSLPEIALGLPLTWGTVPRLLALTGPAVTKRLTILCERVPAEEALALGLADHLTDAGGTEAKAREIAARVLAMPQGAVRMSKEGINACAYALAHLGSHAGADQFTLAGATDESRAARARFGRPSAGDD